MANIQGTNLLDDCWIDRWTNTASVVQLLGVGSHTVFDCNFTNPPSGAAPPLQVLYGPVELTLSNNFAAGFGSGYGLLNTSQSPTNFVTFIPPGIRTGSVTSGGETFLNNAALADSPSILDVTQSPYLADKSGGTDCTSAVQSALNAAISANNGSLVYFPAGSYLLSSTLTASGATYALQGSGGRSTLVWNGADGTTMMTIANPVGVKVQNLCFAPLVGKETSPAIQETSTTTSSAVFDGIYYYWLYHVNEAFQGNDNNPGLGLEWPLVVLKSLYTVPPGTAHYSKQWSRSDPWPIL